MRVAMAYRLMNILLHDLIQAGDEAERNFTEATSEQIYAEDRLD